MSAGAMENKFLRLAAVTNEYTAFIDHGGSQALPRKGWRITSGVCVRRDIFWLHIMQRESVAFHAGDLV